jgi:hypothetical protein
MAMHEGPTNQFPAPAAPPSPVYAPAMASPPAPARSIFDPWLEIVWVRLPSALRRLGSLPALAANDGAGLAAVPPLGAILPPVVFLLGLLCGTVRFATVWSFSESLGVMALFAFVAFFAGAGPGLWMWAGFALGDFFLYRRPDIYIAAWNPLEGFVRTRGALLLLYVLLALLLVVFPLTASALRRVTTLPAQLTGPGTAVAGALIYIVVAAILTYSWSQSVPILQRPIFTWRNDTPTVVAMSPLQQHAHWVVLAAICGAVARIAFETLTRGNMAVQARAERFAAQIAGADRQRITWTSAPLPARLVVGAILTTLLLSGMLPGWGDGILLLLMLVAVYLARQFVSDLVPVWYRLLNRVPLVLRLVAAAVLSRLLTPIILTPLWPSGFNTNPLLKLFDPILSRVRDSTSFRPILLTTLIGLIIATILTPPAPQPRPSPPPDQVPTLPPQGQLSRPEVRS